MFPLVCKGKVDVGFLVDASGSIESYGKGNFRRVVNFVKEVAGSFVISPRGTHIGVVTFSQKPRPIFSFNKYFSRKAVLKAIDNIPYIQGGTRIGLAIRRTTRYLYKTHPHPGRRKILIVMTDGISYDDVIVPARRLRQTGVEIIGLGIGRKFSRRQLTKITANPRKVFTSQFVHLSRAAKKIVSSICSGKEVPY